MDSTFLPDLSDPPERNLTVTEAQDETRVADIAGKAKQDDICEVESEKKELGTGKSGERVENNDIEEHGNIGNVIVGGQGSKSWSLVSPAKIKRSTASTSKGSDEIQISSSKFSVLCDEAEEGEIVGDGQHRDEEETVEVEEVDEQEEG
ncbi:hypothetical protein DY000_02038679 [Brassica cretica]|uniref:Uncharacterized protein n=1 Tax=Brassica cretica TaxID=69181 RepID=A0ABQ7B9J9_BRACR|nr:hypothetical protein DY000_02038679 [Brassica cretica]